MEGSTLERDSICEFCSFLTFFFLTFVFGYVTKFFIDYLKHLSSLEKTRTLTDSLINFSKEGREWILTFNSGNPDRKETFSIKENLDNFVAINNLVHSFLPIVKGFFNTSRRDIINSLIELQKDILLLEKNDPKRNTIRQIINEINRNLVKDESQ